MPIVTQADVNATNRELRTTASVDGGDGKFKGVLATKGCYDYLQNCRGHAAGFGCDECEGEAADGEVARDQGPGICGFDCKVCACDCRCVFQEHNRQKIRVGIGREKKRLEEQGDLKDGKSSTEEN